MSRIEEISGGKIVITEQTLRELLNAVDNHKSKLSELKENEEIMNPIKVSSEYSSVCFEIYCEINPNTQESLGYKINI